MTNEKIIEVLYKLAVKGAKKEEIPVSAIVLYNNKIIAKAYNNRNSSKNILKHAEIIAITKASKKLKTWNLSDCELYVSLKPCSMCEAVINQSHIRNVYFLLEKPNFKKEFSKTKYIKMESEKFSLNYQQLLSNFFKKLR